MVVAKSLIDRAKSVAESVEMGFMDWSRLGNEKIERYLIARSF